MGGNVPSNYYIPAVEKGFYEALEKGTLSVNSILGVRMVLQDGAFHAVDSSELAFRLNPTLTCYIGTAFLLSPGHGRKEERNSHFHPCSAVSNHDYIYVII